MKGKRKFNAKRQYRQLVISGFESVVEHGDGNGNSAKSIQPKQEDTDISGKGSYLLFIPVVIKQVGVSDYQYDIEISFNDDINLPVSAYSKSGKKAIEPSITIPRPKGEKRTSIRMVYGVHSTGKYSLSHPSGRSIPEGIASVYSEVLGAIDRACQRAILSPKQQAGNENARERDKGTRSPESLGTDKKSGRGKKVHSQVLPETLPKESSRMDELNRTILGDGQENGGHTPRELGGVPDNGEAIEGLLVGV